MKTIIHRSLLVAMIAATASACAVSEPDDLGDDDIAVEEDAAGEEVIEDFGEQGAFQADCGKITCTVRANRSTTRRIRDGGMAAADVGGVCGNVHKTCGVALTAIGLGVKAVAGRIYNGGNCIGFRFFKAPGSPGWPVSVRRGTFNCR